MEHLNDFDLADDIALLAQWRSDMQSKLNDLAERSSTEGLTININKTKSLDVNTNKPSNFTVAGQAVKKVENIQYLGSQLASNGGIKIDIGARRLGLLLRVYEMYGDQIRLVNAPYFEYSTQS
ncbi:uncharacterized protein LOC134206380 [Armigeres subalbatus]|uniref:uncharacterized protein LOC134206380 n=1 Tax=Armigeres subalbatus TaxID=124917 RepID=UPI002ED2B103